MLRDDSLIPGGPSPTAPTAVVARTPIAAVALVGVGAIVYVASNVAMGLLLGVVTAFVAEPIFRVVERVLRGRTKTAAFVTAVGVLLAVASGTVVAVWVIASEAMTFARDVQHLAATATLDALVGHGGVRLLDALHVPRPWVLTQAREGASRVQALVAPLVSGVVSATGAGLITSVITFATMYYTLFQWKAASARIEALLPIRRRYTRVLLEEFKQVGRAALLGTLGTALLQGLLATAGYAVAGVPRAALWGLLSGLVAFLPVAGTMLVWAPATLYLLSVNRTAAAVGLLTWSVLVVVAMSDYVIRPMLVGRATPVHPLLVLVSLLGGVETFGLWGVLVGPVLLSVCVAALRLYETEIAPGFA